ncbi:hypothetical protein Tco_1104720 [Tanacetum coccineum]
MVYVDDIIFGSTNKELLQQKEDGIFISQDKYIAKILKKFNYSDVKSASTPVDLEKPLVKDGDADDVDCKKKTVVATSTTEAEYVAAASCCGQVLDLQKAKDAQAKEIAALQKRIQRLERRKITRPTGLKRLRKVGMSRRVESSEDQESLGAPEDASKQGRSIVDIDADVDVSLVDETQKRQNDDLMFAYGVLEDDVMHVEAKVDGKDEQSKKSDDSTAGEAFTNASIDDKYCWSQVSSEFHKRHNLQVLKIKEKESKEKKEEGREETTKGSRKKMLGRKRARKEQQKESSKKQKDEDIAIDAIPLTTKLPVIVDYKLLKDGMMLQGIDREDLEALWRIVKAKYGDTRPENEFERVLYGDLKVMFDADKKNVLSTAEAYGKAAKRKMKGLNASS